MQDIKARRLDAVVVRNKESACVLCTLCNTLRQKRHVEPSSEVISDGLFCFASFAKAGMTHTAIARGRASRRIVDARFRWVNIALGNIKGAITGTCRAIRPRHAALYLAAISAACFRSRRSRRENKANDRSVASSGNSGVIKFRDDEAQSTSLGRDGGGGDLLAQPAYPA